MSLSILIINVNCRCDSQTFRDWVAVYDGINSAASKLDQFCGDQTTLEWPEVVAHFTSTRNAMYIQFVSNSVFNLTTVSKNTYVTGFLGSFQTPNPHKPPCNKYVTYLTTYVGYIRRATKPTVSVPVIWNSFDN